MGAMSWWHWVIVLVVLVILFGSKKLPEAARGLGQSLRIFKSEVSEMQNDGKSANNSADSRQADTSSTPQQLPPSSNTTQHTESAPNRDSKSA